MKNLYSKLKMFISHPIGRKELMCRKEEFCDCNVGDLEGVCMNCGDKKRLDINACNIDYTESE